MLKKLGFLTAILLLSGCVVMPENNQESNLQCSLSTNKKYLRVVDLTDGDTSFYKWQGEIMSIVTMPTSAVVSAAYVAINNVFNFGEKQIKCRDEN